MARVKMGFDRLKVPEQIELTRSIISDMTGNANFLTPNPTLGVMKIAADALETAYNESRGRDKERCAIMRLRRKDLLFLVAQLAAYVQEASGGDEEIILSSGFGIKGRSTPKPDTAGQVFNLRLSDGSNLGKMKARWDAADNAVLYMIEWSLTADFANPVFKGVTTKTHKEIGGLTVGVKNWVRITPFGRENPGIKSDIVGLTLR